MKNLEIMIESDDISYKTSQASRIQQDWVDREFAYMVQMNIQSISAFLQHFDSTVKNKLGELNAKLNKLERSVNYCEASIHTSLQTLDRLDD